MNKQTDIYRHFKGGYYEIFGFAMVSNAEERYVFYRQMYEPYHFWIRPEEMFFGKKQVDGNYIDRFYKIGNSFEQLLYAKPLSEIDVTHSETGGHYRICSNDAQDIFLLQQV